MLNALTIDVEDYFQVHAFEKVIKRSNWDNYSTRVVCNTNCILKLLSEYKVRATFFMLGWIAERHPQLVEQIASNGHEIATHGYQHELIYRQTPKEFADDLNRSIKAIHNALGDYQIIGYRAPSFSITRQSLWALDILRDYGIKYDSSIFPLTAHDRYGISDAKRFIHEIKKDLWEIPVSTLRLSKYNFPVAGGGYFRLFPLPITSWAIRRLNIDRHPAIIYLHPWEFDPKQPRISNASLMSRFRHYVNLDKTENRLRLLLNEFKFAPMKQVFAQNLSI
ncbi:XrtA system polysaccharide deacetylase [Mastigocoleus testarum]|uniref:Polysaccharide deacetylase n=1 Tax=Mastigocoleus testarum BC008 TaxID=371196 RepID=A0A0V7ZPH5_9CYAN|nr:XrtA system polysaccharide deacetylase [Mastigocoleus testarum]KST66015.1 polysaccharide deacetylase [Mastigocoleus testarum BC008]